MDNSEAYELTLAVHQLVNKLDTQNSQQEEANNLIRNLIGALNTNSQELLELRQQLEERK